MAEHEQIRRTLEERLETLEGRVARIEGHLREPANRDWAEHATERENDEVLERLDTAELTEIDAIRQALARIRAGTYGVCSHCGSPIAEARLVAVPHSSACIACAV